MFVDQMGFIPGTMIATPTGPKAIETMGAGQSIYAWDHNSGGSLVSATVIAGGIYPNQDIRYIRSNDGVQIWCGARQPIFSVNKNGYYFAKLTDGGDILKYYSAPVTSPFDVFIPWCQDAVIQGGTLYTLQTSVRFMSYFANNILVSGSEEWA